MYSCALIKSIESASLGLIAAQLVSDVYERCDKVFVKLAPITGWITAQAS